MYAKLKEQISKMYVKFKNVCKAQKAQKKMYAKLTKKKSLKATFYTCKP